MSLKEYRQSKQALGGDVTLAFISEDEDAAQIMQELWLRVYTFEKRFSRFLPGSELSVFNRSAGLRAYITPEFKALLSRAKELSVQTQGLYNPFILPALQRAGYVRSAAPGYEDDEQEDHSHKTVVAIDRLQIGTDFATIPYGTALDFGGCGKGYLAEQLGHFLRESGAKGYWLSLGGDIAVFGKDENGNPMRIAVQDARKLDDSLPVYAESSDTHPYALATSGVFRRKNQQDNGGTWHHIINPKTQEPAKTDILLATICCRDAALADVLASCAIIEGSKQAGKMLKANGADGWLIQHKLTNGDIRVIRSDTMFKTSQTLTAGAGS